MAKRKQNDKTIDTSELPQLESTQDNDRKEPAQKTDSELLGKPQGDSESVSQTETAKVSETPKPPDLSVSKEILANLETYKEELATGEGLPNFDEKPKRGRKRKEPEPQAAPMIVPPKLFVYITSESMANAFQFVDGYISKKPIHANTLSLDKDERAELEPLAAECLKAMKLEKDPITAYFGSLFLLQFTRFLIIKNTFKDGNNDRPATK
ncbi:MAG: hypothetical protein M0R40_09780 [Firmicutes bacterium]|nr:hypothetical protein [Bacillota bacterium]